MLVRLGVRHGRTPGNAVFSLDNLMIGNLQIVEKINVKQIHCFEVLLSIYPAALSAVIHADEPNWSNYLMIPSLAVFGRRIRCEHNVLCGDVTANSNLGTRGEEEEGPKGNTQLLGMYVGWDSAAGLASLTLRRRSTTKDPLRVRGSRQPGQPGLPWMSGSGL